MALIIRSAGGHEQGFRPWDVDEVWRFPASVQDFVPAKHIAHFVREVRDGLDLRAILSAYDEEQAGRGLPQLLPVVDQIKTNTQALPKQLSADGG